MDKDRQEVKLLQQNVTQLKLELKALTGKLENNIYSKIAEHYKEETKEESFSSQLYGYSQDASCHGIRYFLNHHHSGIRKIIWLLLWLTCASVYGYFAVTAFIRFSLDPMVSNYELIHDDKPEFPAMTLCHYTSFRRSVIERLIEEGAYPADGALAYAKQQLRLGKNVNLAITGGKDYALTDLALTFYLHKRGLWSGLETQILEQNLPQSVLDYAREQVVKGKLSIDVKDNLNFEAAESMITEDEAKALDAMRKKDLDNIDYEYVYWSAAHPLETMITSTPTFLNDTGGYKVEYDVEPFMLPVGRVCYTLTFHQPGEKTYLKSNAQSEVNLLILGLQAELNDVYAEPDSFLGQPSVYAMYHERNELVREDEFDQHLPGGKYETRISMTERKVLSKPYNLHECIDTEASDHLNPLKHYPKNYSYAACVDECKNEELEKECGCHRFGFPSTSPICSSSSWASCGSHKLTTDPSLCDHCLWPCFTRQYQAKSRPILNVFNSDSQLRLEVTMDLAHEKITQTPAFPVTSLLGEVGGLLGMYIGASLLSVAEFADFFIVLFCKKKGRNNKTSVMANK